MNKYQQGGQVDQMQLQVIQLVQAAMQGDLKANQQVQQIMQAAKQGDQQAMQIAQMIQSVVKQMQGGTPSAKQGAKLNYLRSLKDQCPEGEELQFFKVGGKVCSKCAKKAQKAACGVKTETPKNKKGGCVSKAVDGIKAEMKKMWRKN